MSGCRRNRRPDKPEYAENNCCVDIYENGKIKSLLITQLIFNYKEIILINNNNITSLRRTELLKIEHIVPIYNKYKTPILVIHPLFSDNLSLTLVKLLKHNLYRTTIVCDGKNSYFLLRRETQPQENHYIEYRECLPFDKNIIGISIWRRTIFNINHPIVSLFINNGDNVENTTRRLFVSFFDLLSNLLEYPNEDWLENLKKLNNLLLEINRDCKTNFELTEKDFPEK